MKKNTMKKWLAFVLSSGSAGAGLHSPRMRQSAALCWFCASAAESGSCKGFDCSFYTRFRSIFLIFIIAEFLFPYKKIARQNMYKIIHILVLSSFSAMRKL